MTFREKKISVVTSIWCTLGHVKSGLPSIRIPPFSTTVGDEQLSFFQMCTELGSSIVLVPVIAVLGNVAIAKAFGMNFLFLCALRYETRN